MTPLGPFYHSTGAQHSTTPRVLSGANPQQEQQKAARQGIPGDPREGGGKKKSKMMFSFPTQLMELYSEWSDKILLGSCCP